MNYKTWIRISNADPDPDPETPKMRMRIGNPEAEVTYEKDTAGPDGSASVRCVEELVLAEGIRLLSGFDEPAQSVLMATCPATWTWKQGHAQ
jgi:hypothetical protein